MRIGRAVIVGRLGGGQGAGRSRRAIRLAIEMPRAPSVLETNISREFTKKAALRALASLPRSNRLPHPEPLRKLRLGTILG